MEDKLRRYVESLFEGTAPTRKATELKEEMIQNIEDKYKDLLSEGKTPEAAFNISVAGIGDVRTLLREVERSATSELDEAAQQKSAMLTAIAVTGYIVSILPLIILSVLIGGRYANLAGVTIMFLLVAGSTGLLVYNSMTKPKQHRDDTMVEEFREWQAETHDRRALRSAISYALWSLVLVSYFILSFQTGAWYITWVLFILGAAIESIINIFFSLKKK